MKGKYLNIDKEADGSADWLEVHKDDRRDASLAQGIMSASNIPLSKRLDQLPPWYDHQLFQRGQKFFHENMFSACLAMFHGLLVILAVPSILSVLVRTNKSSTPYTSYRRYMGTIFHVLSWYDSDFTNPNSKGRQSIREVKCMHTAAGSINQRDMALTQFGFMGFVVLLQDSLPFKKKDLQGFVHFWRVVGYLLGIEDRYNLCQGSVDRTRIACEELREKGFRPWMDQPVKDFKGMATAFVKGMSPVVPMLDPEVMIELTRRHCGLRPSTVPLLPSLLLNYQLFVLASLQYRWIAAVLLPILNFNMWLAFFLQKHAPFVAYLTFKADVRNMY